jgi:hypothetical protein
MVFIKMCIKLVVHEVLPLVLLEHDMEGLRAPVNYLVQKEFAAVS